MILPILITEGISDKSIKSKFILMHSGNVHREYADKNKLVKGFRFKQNTSLQVGLKRYESGAISAMCNDKH